MEKIRSRSASPQRTFSRSISRSISPQHSNTINTIQNKFIIFVLFSMSLFAIANAQRYVGIISPSPNVAVGKCNDTCIYFTFESSKGSVTYYDKGSAYGYAYATDDYEFPRTVLQGLRYNGYFIDVQNNTECGNGFYETYSIGEVSVGADNVSSPCYIAVESILSDKGFKIDASFNPKAAKSNGDVIAPNLTLFALLSLLFPIL